MKTEKEIKDWLKTNMVSMADMLKICRFLQNVDITIPTMTVFNTSEKTTYHHFVKWFNEPNEKFEDEVTEMTLDTFESLVKRCVDDFNILSKPYKNEYDKKFLVRANPVRNNILYDLFNSFQQDFEINGKELKFTNPKFPIGTKVVRKGKPNGKIYTIKEYFAEGRKGVKGRYLAVSDDGSCMYRVRESKLERHQELNIDWRAHVNELMERIQTKNEQLLKNSITISDTIKAELYQPCDNTKKPKYKVGDWVRVKNCTGDELNNGVGKVLAVMPLADTEEGILYHIDCTPYFKLGDEIQPYEPKEGEFVLVEFNDDGDGHRKAIIQVKKWGTDIYDSASLFIRENMVFYKGVSGLSFLSDISYFRPATEEEKQTLIKAVEKKFKKTYCEETKQWVDVKPKSAIDEFNEKQEVRIKRGKDGGFNVYVGDFCTDFLTYDEMLGTVTALLTPPDIRERKCLHWLKTKEQHLVSRCMSPELREEMGITDEEYEVICNR